MEEQKDTGKVIEVLEPTVVTETREKHESPENNLQTYIPQNGGQIQAS